jgi:hypothetical protein
MPRLRNRFMMNCGPRCRPGRLLGNSHGVAASPPVVLRLGRLRRWVLSSPAKGWGFGWRVTQSWTPGLAWLSKQSSARLSLPRSPRRLSRGAEKPANLSGLAGPTDNEYGGTEYGGLPVNYALFVIMLCCSGFRRASVKAAWSARSSSQLISGDIRDGRAHPAYAHPGNPRQSFAVGAGGHDIGRLHQGYGRHRHDPRPEDGRPADNFAGGQVDFARQ